MRRETRHLWVGNLPEDIREERIIEYFKRYGKVQSVRILPKAGGSESNGTAGSSFTNGSMHMCNGLSATVAFIDIKSAAKAHSCENKIEERTLKTDYYEPYHHEDHLSLPGKASGSLPAGSTTALTPNSSAVLSISGGVASSNVASASSFSSSTPSSSSNSSSTSALATATLAINNTSASSSVSVTATSSSTSSSISSTSPATPHSSNASLYGRHTPSRVNDDRFHESRDRSCSSTSRNEGRESSSYLSKRISYHDEGESSREPRSRSSRESSIFSHRSTFMGGVSNSNGSRNVSSTTVNYSDADNGSNSTIFHELPSNHHHPYPNMPGASFSQDNLSTSSSHSNDRPENAAICIKNFSYRSDLSLKDSLSHEFKKYGKITEIHLRGPSSNRYGIVVYRRAEDAERAINESKDKSFYVTRFEALSCENEVDNDVRTNDDPDTRTLVVGCLEKGIISEEQLKKKFSQFGDIEDIKMFQTQKSPSYALIRFFEQTSVEKAMQKNEREKLGWKLSKYSQGNMVLFNGDGDDRFSDEKSIASHMKRYGIVRDLIRGNKKTFLVIFNSCEEARKAVEDKHSKEKDSKTIVDFGSRDLSSNFLPKFRSNHHTWSNNNSVDYDEKGCDRNSRNYHHPSSMRTNSMSSQIRSNNSSGNSYSIRQRSQSPSASPANNFSSFGSRSSVLPSSSSSLHNSSRLSKYDYHHESSNRLSSRQTYNRYEMDDGDNMNEDSHLSSKRDSSRYRSHHINDSYLNDSSPKGRRDSSPYSYLSVNNKLDSDFHRSNRSSGPSDDITKPHDDTHRRANHSKGYHKSGHDSPPLLSSSHSSQLRKSGLLSSASSSSSNSRSPVRDLKSSSHYAERSSPPSPTTSPRTNAYSNHDSARQSDSSAADCGKDYSQWRRKSNEEGGHHREFPVSANELQRPRSDSISDPAETTLNTYRDHHGRDHIRDRFRESNLHRTNSMASPSSLPYQNRNDSLKRKHSSLEIEESANDISGHLERKKRLLACVEQSASSSAMGNPPSMSQLAHHGINNVLVNNTKSVINSLEHRLTSKSLEINDLSTRPKLRDSTLPTSSSLDLVQKRRSSSSSSSSSLVNNIAQLSQNNINGTVGSMVDSKGKNDVIMACEPICIDGNIEEKPYNSVMNTSLDKKPMRNHLSGLGGLILPPSSVNFKSKGKESATGMSRTIELEAALDCVLVDPRHSGHTSRKSVSRTSCDNDLKMMPKASDPSSPFCPPSSLVTSSLLVANASHYGPSNPLTLPLPEFAVLLLRSTDSKSLHALNINTSTSAMSTGGSCASSATLPGGSTSSNSGLTHINIPNFVTSPNSINSIMSPLGNHSPVQKSRLSRDRLSTDACSFDLKKSTDLDDVSDSDISPLLSTTRLDEQIKALDEKFNAWSGTTATSSLFRSEKTPTIDYSKYNIKKKSQNNANPNNSSSSMTNNAGDDSDFFKNLLSKSSVFDQDSKRLEHINEKYEPKDISSLDLDSILTSPKSKSNNTILPRSKLGSSSGTNSLHSLPTEKASHLESQPKVTSHSTSSTPSLSSPSLHHMNHHHMFPSSQSNTVPPTSSSSMSSRKSSDPAWTASINKKEPSSTSTLTPSTPSSAPVRSTTSSMFPQFSRSSSIPTNSTATTPTSRNSLHATHAGKKEALVGGTSSSSTSSSKVDKTKTEHTPLLKSNSIPATHNKEIPKVPHQVTSSSKLEHQASSKLKDVKSDKLEHYNKSKHDFSKLEQVNRREGERKLSDSSDHCHSHGKHDTENPSKEHSRAKSHTGRDDCKDHQKKADREKDKSDKSKDKMIETFNKETKDKRIEKLMLKEKKKNKDKGKEHREKDPSKAKGKGESKKYEGKDRSKSTDKEKKKDKHREKNKNKSHSDVADNDEPIYLSMYDKVKARSSANQSLKSKDFDGKRQKLSQLKDRRQRKEDDRNRSSMDSESDSDSSFDGQNLKQKKLVKKRRQIVKSDSSSDSEFPAHTKRKVPSVDADDSVDSSSSDESCKEKKTLKNHLDWWASKNRKSSKLSSSDSSDDDAKSKMMINKKKKKLKKEKTDKHIITNDKTKDHLKMKKKIERKDKDTDKFKEKHIKSEDEDSGRFVMKKKKKKTKLKEKRHLGLKDDKLIKCELSSDEISSDSLEDEDEMLFNKRPAAGFVKINDSDSETNREPLLKKVKEEEVSKEMFKEIKETRPDYSDKKKDRPFSGLSCKQESKSFTKSGSQSPTKKNPSICMDSSKAMVDVKKHLTSESDTTELKEKESLPKKKPLKNKNKESIKKENKVKETISESSGEKGKMSTMIMSPSKTSTNLVKSCQSDIQAEDASSSDSKIDELLLDDARRLGECMSTSNTDLSLSDSNLSGTNSPLHAAGKSLHPTDLTNILPIVSSSFPTDTPLDPPKPLSSFHPQRSYEQEAAIQSLKLQKELETLDSKNVDIMQKPSFESAFSGFATNLTKAVVEEHPFTVAPSISKAIIQPEELLVVNTEVVESKTEDQTKEFSLEIDCQRKMEDDLAVAALLQDMNDPEETSTHEQSEMRPTDQSNYMNIIAPPNDGLVMTVDSVTEAASAEAILNCNIPNNVIVDDQELKAAVQEIEFVASEEPKLIKPIIPPSPDMFNDDDDEIDSKLIVNEALKKSLQDDLLSDDKLPIVTPIASTLTTSIEIKPAAFPLDSITQSVGTIFGGRTIELTPKDKSPSTSISYTPEPPLEFRKRNSFSSDPPLPPPILTAPLTEPKSEAMAVFLENKSPVFDHSNLLSPHSISADSSVDLTKKSTLDVSLESVDKSASQSEPDDKNSEILIATVAESSGQDFLKIVVDKDQVQLDDFSPNNDSKSSQNKRNAEEMDHEAENVGSKPKRGRRAKNRKYSDSSMHSPRSDQSSGNEQNIPPSVSLLSINTNLGGNSSSAIALLSPTSLSPNTSTTSTFSDISPGSQLKRGKGQTTSVPYRRSCRNASTVATVALDEHEEEADFSHDDQHSKDAHEEETGVKKPSKRGRKKKNSGNTDLLAKSDDLAKSKDRLFPSTESRPKSSNSPYDVFEFRDDEDEELPPTLDPIKSSSHFNVHSHGDDKIIPEKRIAEHFLGLDSAFNGPVTSTLSKQELSTINLEIAPESVGQASFNLGKEYVSEVSQHGKIAITIRLQSKDGQEMECTKFKDDLKEENQFLTTTTTSTSECPTKSVRKSARLMSQTPKSNAEELADEMNKNQSKNSNDLDKVCPYKRITRSYRKSDDTQHESNEDEDQKTLRSHRITRSKGPAISEMNQESNHLGSVLKKSDLNDDIETTNDSSTVENENKSEMIDVKEEVVETETSSVIQSASTVEKMPPVTSPIVSPAPIITPTSLTPVVSTPVSAIPSPTYLQDIPNISERIHHSSTALKLKTGKGVFFVDENKPPVVIVNTPTSGDLAPPPPPLVSPTAKMTTGTSQSSSPVPVVVTTSVVSTSGTLSSSQSITIAPKYQPPVGQPLSQLSSAVSTTVASCTSSPQTTMTAMVESIRPLDMIQTTVSTATTVTPNSVAESMKNLSMAGLVTSVVTTYQSSITDSNKSPAVCLVSSSTPTTSTSVLTKAPQNKPTSIVQLASSPQPSHDLPHLSFNFLQSNSPHLMAPLSSEGFLAQQRMLVAAQQSSTSASPDMVPNIPANAIIPPPFPVIPQVRTAEAYEALMRNNSMLYNMAPPFGSSQAMRPSIPMHRFMYPTFPYPITPETLVVAEQMQQQEMGKDSLKHTAKTPRDDRNHVEDLKAQDFYVDLAQRTFPPNMRYPMQPSSEHLIPYGVNGQGRLPVHTLPASGGGIELSKQVSSQSPTPDQKRPPSKPTFQENMYLQQLQRQMPSPHAHSPAYRKDMASSITEPATGEMYRSQISKEMMNSNTSPLPLNMSAQRPPSRPSSVVYPQATTLSRPSSRSSVVDQPASNAIMKRFMHGSEPTQLTPAMPVQPASCISAPPGGHTPQYGATVPQHIILQKYPVLWNGLLSLKNDQVVVQMHLVSGNRLLVDRALPVQEESHASLRITQRMRLDNAQLQALAKKIQSRDEFCILMALPCGRDHVEVLHQSNNMKKYFITYLQSKLAAGIVSYPSCGYITHIFPPCPFSQDHLDRIAPDLLQLLEGISHLMVVITTAG